MTEPAQPIVQPTQPMTERAQPTVPPAQQMIERTQPVILPAQPMAEMVDLDVKCDEQGQKGVFLLTKTINNEKVLSAKRGCQACRMAPKSFRQNQHLCC
jgi:hypothetical protein